MKKKRDRAEEYKQKLERFEERELKEARVISIDDILNVGVREIYIPQLEASIKYGPVTIGDLEEINKAKTDEERALRMLYVMLRKADPSVTLEKVKGIPLEVAMTIINKISSFLSMPKPLIGGSGRATRRR